MGGFSRKKKTPKNASLKRDDHKKGSKGEEGEKLLLLPLPSSDSIEALMEFLERGDTESFNTI